MRPTEADPAPRFARVARAIFALASSNAQKILEWSFARRPKVLFFPDQHLGRNTGYRMGIPLEQMGAWDFNKPRGGLTIDQIKTAKIILWNGYCSVHQTFKPEQIDQFLERYPETTVISHPEAAFEVCQKSDYIGSTEYILKTVREAEPNSQPAQAQTVSFPCEIAGQFFPAGDVDYFAFQAKKGEVYDIELLSHRLGLPTDPILIVHKVKKNEKGEEVVQEVTQVDDPGDRAGRINSDFDTSTDDRTTG